MNKQKVTIKANAIFLAIVLIAGTIALSFPSFMTGAEAYPYNNNYDNDHKFKYKPSFDKFGKSSSSSYNKCINANLNFPGLDFSPSFGAEAVDALGVESLARDGENSGPNGGHDDGFKKFNKDGLICINANDNSVRGGIDNEEPEPIPEPPIPPPPPQPCEVTVDTIAGFGFKVLGLAFDDDNQRMYVTNQLDGTVSVIDTTTNTLIDTNLATPEIDPIRVGGFPTGIAYDGENQMYVALQNFPGTISVIDTTTNTLIDTNLATPEIDPIDVEGGPFFIAYDDDHNRMYVANHFGFPGTISVIDAAKNTVIDTIENLPGAPEGIAYDSFFQKIYVTHLFDGTVSVIDTTTNTLIDTNLATPEIDPIRVGVFPEVISYDDDHNRMYVANFGDDTVSVIDTATNTVIDTITVGNAPEGIAYNTDNQRIYVTNHDDGTVSVIDTTTTPNTVIDTITVGPSPLGIAHDTDNNRMYVANSGTSTVSVINLC